MSGVHGALYGCFLRNSFTSLGSVTVKISSVSVSDWGFCGISLNNALVSKLHEVARSCKSGLHICVVMRLFYVPARYQMLRGI